MTGKEKLLDDYRAALDWLRNAGHDLSGSRLLTYEGALERFATDDGLRTDLTDDETATFYDAFQAAMDLTLAHEHLGNVNRYPGLRARLAKFIEGPTQERDETPGIDGSTEGRDYGFEIALGAQLADAGIDPFFPVKSEDGDVGCVVDGTDVMIEAKRPQSERSIVRAVRKASTQLDRREAAATRLPVRVIALSFGKLKRGGTLLATAETADDAREGLLAELQALTTKHSGIWQLAQLGGGVAFHGVLLQLEAPVHVRATDDLLAGSVFLLNLSEIDDRGAEVSVLRALSAKLKAREERSYRDVADATP